MQPRAGLPGMQEIIPPGGFEICEVNDTPALLPKADMGSQIWIPLSQG